MMSLIGLCWSVSWCVASALAAAAPRRASRRVGLFMACLLGCPLYGHGAFLVGSADAGVLRIQARDHAHTVATMTNIAVIRPAQTVLSTPGFDCSWSADTRHFDVC